MSLSFDFKFHPVVAEIAPIVLIAGGLMLVRRFSILRALAGAVPLKIAIDALRKKDTWLNERFFDIDSGFIEKLMVFRAIVFFFEGV